MSSTSSSKKSGGKQNGSSKKSTSFGRERGRSTCGMSEKAIGDWGGEKNGFVGTFGVLNVKKVETLNGGSPGEGVSASKRLTLHSFNSPILFLRKGIFWVRRRDDSARSLTIEYPSFLK